MFTARNECPPLGEYLGAGKGRIVYAHALDDSLVVKIEVPSSQDPGQNEQEWLVWCAVKGTPLEIWFCPCHRLGQGWLTMVRAALFEGEPPPRVPEAFPKDATRENCGLLDGRFVCIDYASSPKWALNNFKSTKKLRWT